MIKSTIASGLLATLVIFSSPIHYDNWKAQGFSFAGGFEGFVDYYTWLTPENREAYDAEGNYGSFGRFKDQTERDWRKDNSLDGKPGYSYQVIS